MLSLIFFRQEVYTSYKTNIKLMKSVNIVCFFLTVCLDQHQQLVRTFYDKKIIFTVCAIKTSQDLKPVAKYQWICTFWLKFLLVTAAKRNTAFVTLDFVLFHTQVIEIVCCTKRILYLFMKILSNNCIHLRSPIFSCIH